ncbi:MAG: anion permease [Waddliaceae bacterium]
MKKNNLLLLLTFLVGLLIWFTPPPTGLSPQAWHMFAIFAATIFGIITQPLPMGCMALIGLGALAITGVVPLEETLSGFSNRVVWLIVCAFFIARGFIKTGLGLRLAYIFTKYVGKHTLGLGYSLLATDLLLAPATPSVTARAGGIIFPIIESLSEVFGSKPHDPSSRKLGGFLTTVVFHSTCVTSAMFITAMAANPLIVEIAASAGIEISWGQWALMASVPGLISLFLIPLIIFVIYPPSIKSTPHATQFADEKLKSMGPMSFKELVMLVVFLLLLVLWAGGTFFAINATTTAFLGLILLLVFRVLTWSDIRKEEGAWETLIWFSVLIMMAHELNALGLAKWFGDYVSSELQGIGGWPAFFILSLVYFYSHYIFASSLAHVGALFTSFLILSLALGIPSGFCVPLLAYFSSLFGCLTHYGIGSGAVLFGAGYVPIGSWWRIGFIMSLVYIFIWTVIGGAWWKLLGYW